MQQMDAPVYSLQRVAFDETKAKALQQRVDQERKEVQQCKDRVDQLTSSLASERSMSCMHN
jgi:uncharacterized coiled-coil protein SlyX